VTLPFIKSLLAISCPSAIVWFIVSVYVNPVNAHAERSIPHILKEVGEREPSFAYFNTATSIQAEFTVVGVCASLLHSVPASIHSSPFPFPRHSVSCKKLGADLTTKTPAAFCLPVSKFTKVYATGFTAFATTFPVGLSRLRSVELNCSEHPKLYTSHVNFVVTSPYTSAGFSPSTNKLIRRHSCSVTALAFANPPRATIAVVIGSFNHSQLTKCLARNVFEFCHVDDSFNVNIPRKTRKGKALPHVNSEVPA
jgi:hypothetical protein